MELKHTPGPWFAGLPNFPIQRGIRGPDARLVARINEGNNSADANANLIAASPALLAYAKCEEARASGEDIAETVLAQYGFDSTKESATEFMDKMRRAAIAKATGGA